MEPANDIKIIGMLGELNNKVSDMRLVLDDVKERMNRNFCLLAESQVSANNKLSQISEDIKDIKFSIEVLEAGVGMNANKIESLTDSDGCRVNL